MGHAPTVTVLNALSQLLEQELGFGLGHLPVWESLQVGVQTSALQVLHYQVDLLVSVECLVKPGYVFVVESFKDFYFSLHTLAPVRIQQF